MEKLSRRPFFSVTYKLIYKTNVPAGLVIGLRIRRNQKNITSQRATKASWVGLGTGASLSLGSRGWLWFLTLPWKHFTLWLPCCEMPPWNNTPVRIMVAAIQAQQCLKDLSGSLQNCYSGTLINSQNVSPTAWSNTKVLYLKTFCSNKLMALHRIPNS